MSISRKTICQELKINDYQLTEYEFFLKLPEINNAEFDYDTARIIARLHNYHRQGISLGDLRQLSHLAENYGDQIPSLKEFEEFSPHHHLQELLEYCSEVINELNSREKQYQDRIANLEDQINEMQIDLDKKSTAVQHYEMLIKENRDLESLLPRYEQELKDSKQYINELEVYAEQLKFELDKRDEEIKNFSYEFNRQEAISKRIPVDLDALVKRKEREVLQKYQREISDLKKQVADIS